MKFIKKDIIFSYLLHKTCTILLKEVVSIVFHLKSYLFELEISLFIFPQKSSLFFIFKTIFWSIFLFFFHLFIFFFIFIFLFFFLFIVHTFFIQRLVWTLTLRAHNSVVNPLSTYPTKWSNTLKKFVGNRCFRWIVWVCLNAQLLRMYFLYI